MAAISGSPPAVVQDRYALEAWLGKSSKGTLYLARDEYLARPVAIRFMNPGSSEDGERFLQTAQLAARLAHPSIASIYDFGAQAGWHYLVSEYIAGGNLAQLRLRHGGRLPAGQVLSLAHQALEALSYAHTQGIAHGSLTPENMLLAPSGALKITDFGLEPGARPPAAAPLADLYALGVVLCLLLTGEIPFTGDSPGRLPSGFTPGTSPAFDDFLLRLLSHEPQRCFSNAGQALLALEKAVSSPGAGSPTEPLLVLAQSVGPAQMLEAERRRLAESLRHKLVDPLGLLVAQSAAYEQSFGSQPAVRMAFSVLTLLSRQLLQQARDLESSLQPAILEALGLEPALESLAGQAGRGAGLQLELALERLPGRLPQPVELAVFRWVQAMLLFLEDAQVASAHLGLSARRELPAEQYALRCRITAPASPRLLDLPAPALEESFTGLYGRVDLAHAAGAEISWTAVLPLPSLAVLTPREQEVLHCLVEGLANKQIAARLAISQRTVNYHLDHIFSKLGVRTRTEAALLALRHGLVRS